MFEVFLWKMGVEEGETEKLIQTSKVMSTLRDMLYTSAHADRAKALLTLDSIRKSSIRYW